MCDNVTPMTDSELCDIKAQFEELVDEIRREKEYRQRMLSTLIGHKVSFVWVTGEVIEGIVTKTIYQNGGVKVKVTLKDDKHTISFNKDVKDISIVPCDDNSETDNIDFNNIASTYEAITNKILKLMAKRRDVVDSLIGQTVVADVGKNRTVRGKVVGTTHNGYPLVDTGNYNVVGTLVPLHLIRTDN